MSHAQQYQSLSRHMGADSLNHLGGVDYEVSYGSNTINTAILYGAVFKTEISRDVLENITAKSMRQNRAGYDGGGTLWYRWKHGRADSLLKDTIPAARFSFVSLGTREHIDAVFSKDALLLIAQGNKQFAGRTAEVGDLRLQILRYTQLRYGQTWKTKRYTAGAGISGLIGHQYFNATAAEARLFTSDIGDSLHATALGQMRRSDTAAKVYFDPNGIGLSLDLYIETSFDLFSKNRYQGRVAFELSDIGFIWWDNKSLRMEVDGEYAWSGFEAADITKITDSLINAQRPTKVQNQLVKHNDKGSYTISTLPRIAVYYSEQLSERWYAAFGLQHRLFAGQLPMFTATESFLLKASKKSNPKLVLHQALGGYNLLSVGAGFEIQPGNFNIQVGMRNLPATLLAGRLAGFNAYLLLSSGYR
jgi:hypothetical protein